MEHASKLIEIPHEGHESTCYVNGLFDVLTWKGAKYDYFLLPIIGGMASFAFLKFKMAKPPCMVYWGNNSRYLLKDLGEIIGFTQTISEGKSFKNEFPKMKEHLDNDEPVMVGALDMYFLNYYSELYKKEHIPIHYLLLVGYDEEKQELCVHDCTYEGVQVLYYEEFEKSLNVNVPGLSKKNTYRIFRLPRNIPTELEVAEKLEQLRALEHGYKIKLIETDIDTIGVDTPEDLEKVKARMLKEKEQGPQ